MSENDGAWFFERQNQSDKWFEIRLNTIRGNLTLISIDFDAYGLEVILRNVDTNQSLKLSEGIVCSWPAELLTCDQTKIAYGSWAKKESKP